MKKIWMSEPTLEKLAESMPPGETLCPRCGGAGEVGIGNHRPDYRTEQCYRCRGNGTVRL